MKPKIEKLDREAMLMLYAAGELSLEQKQRVDAMLAADEAMRHELSQLQGAQAMFNRELSEMDRKDPLPISEAAASRAVSRVIRQRQAEQFAKPLKVGELPRRRWLVLMYPAGIAAAIMAFGIYKWSKVSDNEQRTPMATKYDTNLPIEGDTPEVEAQYAMTVIPNLDDSPDQLDGVEDQIAILASWSKPTQ
jgi:hypothetical protein